MTPTMPLARWLLSLAVLAGILFVCAGRIDTPMLAAYLAVFADTGLATAISADPSLDSERREPGPEEVSPNSRKAATVLFLVTVLVDALDAGRFHWSQPVNGRTQIAALVVLILAAGLQVWAMAVNPFFSTAIRIQRERRYELVTRGPYRFIRHPGYLAMMFIMPATALTLGSIVALLPAFCYSGLILCQAAREDGFLANQLPSYAEYTARVRYCLIPHLQ